MKVWTKIKIKDRDPKIDLISKALTNYIYTYGPINSIIDKYNISKEEYMKLNQYTADRICGILMLYLANDIDRINDIANKYNLNNGLIKNITPEIEGYINKTQRY